VIVDDHRLILDTLAGDLDAFGVIVQRYQDRLFQAVYRRLENAEDSQDVVQEAFLSAYQSLDSFKGDAQFFTWLYRIALNTAISLKRKQRVALRLDLGSEAGGPIDPPDTSNVSRPDHGMEQVEREQRVRRALDRLSPEHRAVLVMKDMEGQKYETMAEILEVPVGTIRSRLHRARLELRGLLEKDEG
jgi:RNA polymerase sigma-70 factor (ECF subfamily)